MHQIRDKTSKMNSAFGESSIIFGILDRTVFTKVRMLCVKDTIHAFSVF